MQRAAVGFPHNDRDVVAQFFALPIAVQAAKLGIIYICTGYPLASTDHKILWFLSSHPGKSATVCRADKWAKGEVGDGTSELGDRVPVLGASLRCGSVPKGRSYISPGWSRREPCERRATPG